MTGWKCPGCGACYSPYTPKCQHCGPKATSTITTSPSFPPPWYKPETARQPWTRPENIC